MLKILLLTYTITFVEVQNIKSRLEFMNFSKNEVREVINHVSTRWKMFRENIDAMELFVIIFSV